MASKSNEFEIPAAVRRKLASKTWLKKQLAQERHPQDILGFSNDTMDKFYLAAKELFQNKHYKDAADAFLFLATLNPTHYDYWLGFGAATQWCGEYENAIDAYEMAALCQLNNPIPYLHLAKCLFSIHDRESALQAIEMALEYSEGDSNYTEVYHQAKAAKELLLKAQ